MPRASLQLIVAQLRTLALVFSSGEYRGLQGVTGVYMGLQGVTKGYKGLMGVTRDDRG